VVVTAAQPDERLLLLPQSGILERTDLEVDTGVVSDERRGRRSRSRAVAIAVACTAIGVVAIYFTAALAIVEFTSQSPGSEPDRNVLPPLVSGVLTAAWLVITVRAWRSASRP
jgi:hypothetical protein